MTKDKQTYKEWLEFKIDSLYSIMTVFSSRKDAQVAMLDGGSFKELIHPADRSSLDYQIGLNMLTDENINSFPLRLKSLSNGGYYNTEASVMKVDGGFKFNIGILGKTIGLKPVKL